MFVILSYDINHKRVGKVLRICRKYLAHMQKSVFEGKLTESELNRLKAELKKVIKLQEDSICIYQMDSVKYARKEQIGVVEQRSNII